MSEKSVDVQESDDLRVERRGAMVRLVLGRMRALNALTIAMRARMAAALPGIARDPSLYIVVIRSLSPKAFSAGGDVRELVALHRENAAAARRAFAEEYALNWALDCFSKPTVSLIDGMVMGSGVGISLYNTHRVAGEGYRFAMPETAIGLFPDVGVAHALSRLPHEIGTYLGLTGRSIGRADAVAYGLVTHCIPGAAFDGIEAALADAQPVDTLLDSLHTDPGPGEIASVAALIERCFGAPTVEEIRARLAAEAGAGQAFAAEVSADLDRRSPTSLKITLRHIRAAREMDLREVLMADQRLACRCLAAQDFAEGVRAALVEKDNRPVWQPARLEDVGSDSVDAYFAPLPPENELRLASRADTQAARY